MPDPEDQPDLNIEGDLHGDVNAPAGDSVAGDKVGGDKIAGDKVAGDKIINLKTPFRLRPLIATKLMQLVAPQPIKGLPVLHSCVMLS